MSNRIGSLLFASSLLVLSCQVGAATKPQVPPKNFPGVQERGETAQVGNSLHLAAGGRKDDDKGKDWDNKPGWGPPGGEWPRKPPKPPKPRKPPSPFKP